MFRLRFVYILAWQSFSYIMYVYPLYLLAMEQSGSHIFSETATEESGK